MPDESRLDRFEETTEHPPHPAYPQGAWDELLERELPIVMRGYDRAAVDSWRDEVAALVDRLEQHAPREDAVKRALDQVGQETSAILQRAHEAADEITSRSRSQADARLRRAEGEAEITTREAELRASQLEDDARAVWDARARMIEELRQLADEVLAVADDALERLDPPPGSPPMVEAAPVEPEPSEPSSLDPGLEPGPVELGSVEPDPLEPGSPGPDSELEPQAGVDDLPGQEERFGAPEPRAPDHRAPFDADELAEQPTVEAPAADLPERDRS